MKLAGTAKEATKEVQKEQKKEKATYTKEQILVSAKFCDKRDLVNALLEDDKGYTLEEVDSLIKKYLKGKVK